MKWIILFVLGSFFCFSFFRYESNGLYKTKNYVTIREKRYSSNQTSYEESLKQTLPLKKLRRLTNGLDHRNFVVDRNDIDSLQKFISRSGNIIGHLTLKNFDTLERITDVWHHRLMKSAKFDMRKTIFDFTRTKGPVLLFDNCYDGWFPFENFEIKGNVREEKIAVINPVFKCDLTNTAIPKYMKLVDRFGSFAVRIDHKCPWRYWNFDISNVNIDDYNTNSRSDLNYTSSVQVVSLKLKGFESNMKFLRDRIVKPFRLDWIKDVGLKGVAYHNGCLVIEDTDPHAVIELKELRQLHYDRENFKKSAPFVIRAQHRPCLKFSDKQQLFEKFGIVALHIIDQCPLQKRVLILDGRQPFDYVTNRDDLRYHQGDTFLYARIRFFTEKHHLENLDTWFYEMGYHNITIVGEWNEKLPEVPEVTISGCISTFNPFPYYTHAERNYKPTTGEHPPFIYFRNNSGLDCVNRRVVNTLKRSIGKFVVASSRDCECSRTTFSDFFWANCLTHRGTLEITGSPNNEELLRLTNIRRIRDGQLWIHDTISVSNLDSFHNLEEVQCQQRHVRKGKRHLSAVRVGGSNLELESIELPKLSNTEYCDRLVSISGNKMTLPKYSESKWMKVNSAKSSVNIDRESKKCVGYSGRGGGMSAEFAHQLENCDTIDGDLIIDGKGDNITKIGIAIRNIRRITGNVVVRNIDEEYCSLLRLIKFIDGSFTYDNNPSLKHLSLSLLHVKGDINITRVPRFCLQLQTIRFIVEAFKIKQLNLDCPFHEKSMFDDFETRFGKLEIFTDLSIAFSFAFFVCYMMPNALLAPLRALNVSRWREMTELDLHLKIDSTAYLDEDSSDDEPDLMTWKRKTLVKNRLDGRDIEGEKLEKEKKQYKDNRRKIKLSQKMGAMMRRFKRQDSDSEFSGHSWLRRKQKRKRKYEDVPRDVNIPFPVLVKSGEYRWRGKMKNRYERQEDEGGKEGTFVVEFNETIKQVLDAAAAEDYDTLMTIIELMEKNNLTKNKKEIVTEYRRLENILATLQSQVEKADKEKWIKWTKMRQRLRIKAMREFGVEDFEPPKEHRKKKEFSLRLKAGAQNEYGRQKSRMFAKVIVQTMHWKTSDEETSENNT